MRDSILGEESGASETVLQKGSCRLGYGITLGDRIQCSALLEETDGPMKITDVTTTILHDPNRRPLLDSAVPDLWKR